jgi:hypothetical protein
LLTELGDHVPVTEFDDVFGNVGTAPPEQILNEVPKLNVGTKKLSTSLVGKSVDDLCQVTPSN